MFLYLNRSAARKIQITANEGRGDLSNAIIRIHSIIQNKTVELDKENISDFPERYDEFEIYPEDIEDIVDGDVLYSIFPGDQSDIDPDTELESGRGRIYTQKTETVTIYDRTEEAVIYERD